ncbi:MAG TPA: glycosyltransferase, partial [Nitrospiraceae bacterium]|nr:glycosyltransferase [Nitrospiraceae bacterium]
MNSLLPARRKDLEDLKKLGSGRSSSDSLDLKRKADGSNQSIEAIQPLTSVVVPVFNEQDNVAHLIKRLINALDSLGDSYEVLFIDDGSRDATWNRIADAAV